MLNRFIPWRSLHLPPILWFRLANHAQRQGQLFTAITCFEKFLAQRPQHDYAWQRLVDLHTMLGSESEATSCCRRWLAVKPNSTTAWQQLGKILLAQDKVWPALTAFKTSLIHYQQTSEQQTGSGLPTSLAITIAASGDQLRHRNQWKAAAYAYQLALKLQVDQVDWHLHRAQALLKEQDWSEAARAAKAAIALDATCATAYQRLGQAASCQPDWPLAAFAYHQAIMHGSQSPWTRLDWAKSLAKQARWSDAAFAYQQAFECNSTQRLPIAIYRSYSDILKQLNDWPALLHHSQQAMTQYPNEISFLKDLALAHHRLDYYATAITLYEQVVQRHPQPWLHHTLARLLIQQNNLQAAREQYDQAITTKSDWNAMFHWTWAQIWRKATQTQVTPASNPDWSRAIKAAQAALDQGLQEDHQVQAYQLLSQGYQTLGNQDAAVMAQQQAYQIATTARLFSDKYTEASLGLSLADLQMQAKQSQEAALLYWQYLPQARSGIPGYGRVPWETWKRAIASLAHWPAAATIIARQALLFDPSDVARRFQVAECLMAQRSFSDAIPYYHQILDQLQYTHDPDAYPNHASKSDATRSPQAFSPSPVSTQPVVQYRADLLRRLAAAEYLGNQTAAAVATYQQLATLGTTLTETDYRTWGDAAESLEQWDLAITCYTQATQAFPQQPYFYQQLGSTQAQQSAYLAAAKAYGQAIQLDPELPAWVYSKWCSAWQSAGSAYLQSTLVALKTSIERYPLNARFREQLGRLYLDQGEVPRAVTALWQAVAIDPDAADATIELVHQLFALNAGAIALSVYQQACDRQIDLPADLHRQCADWLATSQCQA